MTVEPAITFRGLAASPALEANIMNRIRKLDGQGTRIVRCNVLVEFGERRHECGNHYHVRILLIVPRGELVIAHTRGLHATARDVGDERARKATETDREQKSAYVAVRQAFDVARRQLQDFTRRRRALPKGVRARARRA